MDGNADDWGRARRYDRAAVTERERDTRWRRIDPNVKAAGWAIADAVTHSPGALVVPTALTELPTSYGPADYALCDDGRVIGVVEAKKLTIGPEGVLTQAERYSRGIRQQPRYQGEYGVPFLYSTNGERIRFHDVRRELNRSRDVAAFHTPGALREMLDRNFDAELAKLQDIAPNQGLRPYQIEANQAIGEAIAAGKRRMLVTMATGTGKTLMTVNEIYRLMKSGVARRVLFLVDRRALAAQTVRAFASYEAEPGLKFDKVYPVYSQRFQQADLGDESFDPNVMPNTLLTKPKLGDAFVYVSTIQRMTMNLFGGEGALTVDGEAVEPEVEKLDIPIHAFDLIVADECHRGYSAKERAIWRDTLDHFDAIKIGLTATPAAHTMAYFENLAFRYDYDQAVRDGYLVDYDVVKVSSDVRINGIFLTEGEQVDQVDVESGAKQLDLLDDERSFDASAVEREITAPDSNRRILAELKTYTDAFEAEHGRFPKTLIFAANDLPHTSHADQLVDQARDVFGQGESFVTKITGRVDRPLQRIREFRNRAKPAIVVTVDLLTTGVDIPDLEFIVFLRPVKSRILFEQMLGRGTRLGDKAADKDHFTVFDCFDGTLIEYFAGATGITVEPPEGDGKSIGEIIEEIWRNEDRAYNIKRLVRRLRRIDKTMTGEARDLFAKFVADGDIGAFAEDLPKLLAKSFSPTMQTLHDKDFQRLLDDYPRGQRTFIIAPTVMDTVGSEWLIRGADGKQYQPDDYITVFFDFVKDNADAIDALAILLSRPKDWNPEALLALRDALKGAPQHFTEQNLERAFRARYHKALVDIISMVKHATADSAPLLTAAERVDAAVAKVVDGRDLSEAQSAWIDRIRLHLIENLSIDRDDFSLIPALSDHGGWRSADRTFEGELAELLADVNRELAAV
jgi:type I restriction enzyme R subunit